MTPSESPDRLERHTDCRSFQDAEERGRERARREAAEAREQARQEQALLEDERQAKKTRRKKMTQVQWTGDRLEPGDNPDSHFARVEDVLGLDSTDSFVYPNDYADAALRGTLDTRPGSRSIRLFMLSLDQDLAADLRAKDGLTADAENQLQVQAFAVPDVAATVFRRFSQCSMEELKNALRRAALSSETVDTLITEFEGQIFEPGDDLSRWFDARDREYRRLRGQLSMREFRRTLALLLPDDTFHQAKVVAMSRAPASLREVVEDCDSGQMATVKKELLAGAATLAKAAKKCGIRGQVWWVKPEDKKTRTKK